MTPDAVTPCPGCPEPVRAVYASGRRVLARLQEDAMHTPEYAEFYTALEQLRPFIEAHHANQLHAFSAELEAVRIPSVPA